MSKTPWTRNSGSATGAMHCAPGDENVKFGTLGAALSKMQIEPNDEPGAVTDENDDDDAADNGGATDSDDRYLVTIPRTERIVDLRAPTAADKRLKTVLKAGRDLVGLPDASIDEVLAQISTMTDGDKPAVLDELEADGATETNDETDETAASDEPTEAVTAASDNGPTGLPTDRATEIKERKAARRNRRAAKRERKPTAAPATATTDVSEARFTCSEDDCNFTAGADRMMNQTLGETDGKVIIRCPKCAAAYEGIAKGERFRHHHWVAKTIQVLQKNRERAEREAAEAAEAATEREQVMTGAEQAYSDRLKRERGETRAAAETLATDDNVARVKAILANEVDDFESVDADSLVDGRNVPLPMRAQFSRMNEVLATKCAVTGADVSEPNCEYVKCRGRWIRVSRGFLQIFRGQMRAHRKAMDEMYAPFEKARGAFIAAVMSGGDVEYQHDLLKLADAEALERTDEVACHICGFQVPAERAKWQMIRGEIAHICGHCAGACYEALEAKERDLRSDAAIGRFNGDVDSVLHEMKPLLLCSRERQSTLERCQNWIERGEQMAARRDQRGGGERRARPSQGGSGDGGSTAVKKREQLRRKQAKSAAARVDHGRSGKGSK